MHPLGSKMHSMHDLFQLVPTCTAIPHAEGHNLYYFRGIVLCVTGLLRQGFACLRHFKI